jgi:hypothetical protein
MAFTVSRPSEEEHEVEAVLAERLHGPSELHLPGELADELDLGSR